MKTKIDIQDLWTTNPEYLKNYQTEDDVSDIIRLLDLENAKTVLDNGCGNGAIAIKVAREYGNIQVFAYDALQGAIDECNLKGADLIGKNLQTGVSWADDIPLSDSSVDRILFRNVLHHISKPESVYAEFGRLLKPGGKLVLQTPCNYWEESFGEFFSELFRLMDQTHQRQYHRPDVVVAGLEKVGLVTENQFCWKFSFPFIDANQVKLINKHNVAKRLLLKQIETDKWSIEFYWLRIVAMI